MIGVLVLALAQSGATSAAQADELRVVSLPTQVDFGVAFEVVVERAWPAAVAPPTWRDASLAPLRVHTMAREVRERDGLRIERRRLRAWAFSIGQLDVAGRALSVTGVLDPAAPGALEIPEVPPVTTPTLLWVARAMVVLLLIAVVYLVVRRARRPGLVAVVGVHGLEQLRAWADAPQLADGGEALRAALALCCLHCCGVDAHARTTQELLDDPRVVRGMGATGLAAFRTLRQAADAARFAGQQPGDPESLAAAALELVELLALPALSTREAAA